MGLNDKISMKLQEGLLDVLLDSGKFDNNAVRAFVQSLDFNTYLELEKLVQSGQEEEVLSKIGISESDDGQAVLEFVAFGTSNNAKPQQNQIQTNAGQNTNSLTNSNSNSNSNSSDINTNNNGDNAVDKVEIAQVATDAAKAAVSSVSTNKSSLRPGDVYMVAPNGNLEKSSKNTIQSNASVTAAKVEGVEEDPDLIRLKELAGIGIEEDARINPLPTSPMHSAAAAGVGITPNGIARKLHATKVKGDKPGPKPKNVGTKKRPS